MVSELWLALLGRGGACVWLVAIHCRAAECVHHTHTHNTTQPPPKITNTHRVRPRLDGDVQETEHVGVPQRGGDRLELVEDEWGVGHPQPEHHAGGQGGEEGVEQAGQAGFWGLWGGEVPAVGARVLRGEPELGDALLLLWVLCGCGVGLGVGLDGPAPPGWLP